jgi:hypothetical protein
VADSAVGVFDGEPLEEYEDSKDSEKRSNNTVSRYAQVDPDLHFGVQNCGISAYAAAEHPLMLRKAPRSCASIRRACRPRLKVLVVSDSRVASLIST